LLQPLDEAEVELASVNVHMSNFNANDIAQAEAIARPMTGERVRGGIVAVEVVRERADVNQPLRRQFDTLGIQAETNAFGLRTQMDF